MSAERADDTLPGVTPNRTVIEVEVFLDMVPHARLGACDCGRVFETDNKHLVMLARQRKPLPAMKCKCGRALIGKARLVQTVGAG